MGGRAAGTKKTTTKTKKKRQKQKGGRRQSCTNLDFPSRNKKKKERGAPGSLPPEETVFFCPSAFVCHV
jgi:hypothetical protein